MGLLVPLVLLFLFNGKFLRACSHIYSCWRYYIWTVSIPIMLRWPVTKYSPACATAVTGTHWMGYELSSVSLGSSSHSHYDCLFPSDQYCFLGLAAPVMLRVLIPIYLCPPFYLSTVSCYEKQMNWVPSSTVVLILQYNKEQKVFKKSFSYGS